MKTTKKKCYECGKKQVIQIVEDVTFEGKCIETHTVADLAHERCLNCNGRFFGPEAQKIIDRHRRKMFERPFNGKVSLRIPKSLHARLYRQAKQEGVSLNQLCLYLLSSGAGKEGARKQKRC